MDAQDIREETKEAVETAAQAVEESAKASADAVETAAENVTAVKEATEAVEESAKANANAVESAAKNKEAAEAAAHAVEEGAQASVSAVETAAENKEAVKEAADAVEGGAKSNANAVETASENKAAGKVKPHIPQTPKESMKDYAAAIDNSMRDIEEGDLVTGTIIAISEDDATVDLNHYSAGTIRRGDFSANPKFNIREDVKVGDEVTAVVKRKDDGHGNLLLSVKEAAQTISWDKLKTAMDEKKNVSVKIVEAVKAGVLCYPEGLRAFIPASKLALTFVEEKDLPTFIGKTIETRVITCDKKENKLVLSAKEILREAADKERAAKVSNLKVGLVTEGTVESLTDFGAFVDLGEGLTGLVHVSRISQTRIKAPSDVLKVGDKVKVKVVALKDGKISLSMKDLEDQQAVAVEEEKFEYKSEGEATTSLADLIKQAGF